MISRSAVLLAGGKSQRMGQDKALLFHPATGLPLWQHQLKTLQALQVEQIYWSGLPRVKLDPDINVVEDLVAEAGPLAGISACLQLIKTDLLIVLAIDLPQMTSRYLQNLIDLSLPTCGVIARSDLYFEPLAGIYPRALKNLAFSHLHQGQFAMQMLLQKAEQLGMIRSLSIDEHDKKLFKNVNTPDDLS